MFVQVHDTQIISEPTNVDRYYEVKVTSDHFIIFTSPKLATCFGITHPPFPATSHLCKSKSDFLTLLTLTLTFFLIFTMTRGVGCDESTASGSGVHL